MKKSLLVLAAGMGSRYGGLKQMDPVGPSGEFILDYSIHDALHAGFSEVIFVIRRDIEADFRRLVGSRWEKQTNVHYAFQALDDLPAGFTVPQGRTKPWGTGHAVLAARKFLNHPFAVVNADDFYGRDAYVSLAKELDRGDDTAYAMVAYDLGRTLSEHGGVARGICTVDAQGYLTHIEELTSIMRDPDGKIRAGQRILAEDTPASMNLFGFKPSFVGILEEAFAEFMGKVAQAFLPVRTDKNVCATLPGKDPEFFMPMVVGSAIARGLASVKVLRTQAEWFGVTNAADRPLAVAKFAALAEQGVYPKTL